MGGDWWGSCSSKQKHQNDTRDSEIYLHQWALIRTVPRISGGLGFMWDKQAGSTEAKWLAKWGLAHKVCITGASCF